MIFDIDSHFEPGDNWLDPYPDLAARLPNLETGITAVEGVAGDLLRHVPEAERPSLEELMPPGLLTLYAQEKGDEADRRAEFEGHNQFEIANAAARVRWLDDQGIDIQNVICLSGMGYGVALEDQDPPLERNQRTRSSREKQEVRIPGVAGHEQDQAADSSVAALRRVFSCMSRRLSIFKVAFTAAIT